MKTKSDTHSESLRHRPLYTLTDVARYARVQPDTLRSWAGDLFEKDGAEGPSPFSFVNLVEVHVLMALRRIHRVKMNDIRKAIDWLIKQSGTIHPLAELDLETGGKEIFVRFFGVPVSASAGGQAAFPQIVDLYLSRIERDKDRLPTRFYPFTYDNCPKTIVMDPAVAFGRPVVVGTRVATTMVFDRYSGGESLTAIADDYGLDIQSVEEALRCEIERRAA